MISRRRLCLLSIACAPALGRAQQRRSLADPLRVGVDPALLESGLAPALQRAFGRDTGIAALLVPMPALPLLQALERGEVDVALANAPDAEARLEQQGLAHDRQLVAQAEFVIVGPAPRGREKDPAAIAGLTSAADALIQLRSAALAMPGRARFLSAGDGSGTHVAEQALWRAAKLAPTSPWYANAAGGSAGLIAEARAGGAYALVERGAWSAHGGSPLAVLVEGDAALQVPVHVLRSFRVNHPAGKMFVAWLAGPKGRRIAQAQRGYRPVPR